MQQENKKAAQKRVLIQLRTNEEDKKKIEDFAKAEGMNITDFVKSRTLGKAPRTKMATPVRETLIRLLAELGKIGSNINQIAKAMNTAKTPYSVSVKEEVISRALEGVNTLSNHILKELEHGDGKGQGPRQRQPTGELPSGQSG